MSVVGTAILPLTAEFPPVDRVFRARVRVVAGLPFGLIPAAAYMHHYNSVLGFEGTDSSKPSGTLLEYPS